MFTLLDNWDKKRKAIDKDREGENKPDYTLP